MCGGAKFEYLWADGNKYKKPTALPANKYISLLMDWIEAQINDDKMFPVTVGKYIYLPYVFFIMHPCPPGRHIGIDG